MNPLLLLFLLHFFAVSCNNPTKAESKTGTAEIPVLVHSYQNLNAPAFFSELASNHLTDLSLSNDETYLAISNSLQVDTADSSCMKAYSEIFFLHKIFTSSGAYNGALGEIERIPYMWHWCDPNPRYEIIQLSSGKKLSECKPPPGFGKYRSYADIDRTPFLFISELLSDELLYEHPACGQFKSFGWCSEREMAFTCMMELMGYPTKVVVEGNHSWSEIKLSLPGIEKKRFVIIKVDNTFDSITCSTTTEDLNAWQKPIEHKTARWYNDKAHTASEQDALSKFHPSNKSMSDIEHSVVAYLNR